MRMHTALHLLSVVFPFPVTGGSVGEDKGRLDFDMPEVPDDLAELEAQLNAMVGRQSRGDRRVDHRRGDGRQRRAHQDHEGQAADGPGPRAADPHRRRRPAALRRHACRATRREIGPLKLGKIEKKGAINRRVALLLRLTLLDRRRVEQPAIDPERILPAHHGGAGLPAPKWRSKISP